MTGLYSKHNITFKSIETNNIINQTMPTSNATNSTAAINKKSNKIVIKILEVFSANASDNGPFVCYADNIVGKVIEIVNVTINCKLIKIKI